MSRAQTNSGIRRAVYEERLFKTPGNLVSSDFKENSNGKIVSIKASKAAQKNFKNQAMDGPKGWNLACKHAAKDLEYWPVPIKKGTEFYKLAKQYHNQLKD